MVIGIKMASIWRGGLIGGVRSLEVSFKFSKDWYHSQCDLLLFPACRSRCKLLTVPPTMPWLCHHGFQQSEAVGPTAHFLLEAALATGSSRNYRRVAKTITKIVCMRDEIFY